MTDPTLPPAAWHPDPSGAPQLRFWNGREWTDHVAPLPGGRPLAPSAPAPAAAPIVEPLTGRRRRGPIIAWVAAGAALLLGGGTALAFGIPAMMGAATATPEGADPRYAYAQPLLELDRDHEFEIPAEYDLEAVAGEHTEVLDNGVFDSSFAVAVYTDAALTRRASYYAFQHKPGEPISIYSAELSTAHRIIDVETGAGGDEVRVKTEELSRWGLSPSYYLVQRLDARGEPLAKPIVTKFTVKQQLAAPSVTIDATLPGGEIALNWSEIDGADEYLVVATRRSADFLGGDVSQVLATTSQTEWSSDDLALTAGDDRPWVLSQNEALRQFRGDSEDGEVSGASFTDTSDAYTIGVIARDGEKFSPMLDHDLVEIAGALPYEIAHSTAQVTQRYDSDKCATGLDEISPSFFYTSLDGRTRAAVAEIDEGYLGELGGCWRLALTGQGTRLGDFLWVDKEAVPDPAPLIAEFNAAARAAAPPTGDQSLIIAREALDTAEEAMTTAPPTEYPIFGSSPMVRYLGQHFVGQTRMIDLSEYTSALGAPDPYDAIHEAIEQNPYAPRIENLVLSPDGTRISVTYHGARSENTATQAAIATKVDEVVSSVVDPSTSDADKAIALNDWLIGNAEYDHDSFDLLMASPDKQVPDGREYAWSPEGVLLRGAGVCASYAGAFKLLAEAAGLETVVVRGDVLSGGPHAWNKVRIDGAWRAVDPTWNDSPDPNRYLLISDAGFTDAAERVEDGLWMLDGALADYAAR
ncbi:transglutaminase domain-containing protein [Agromyces italicus]|uniref:transglutaminase domain-containing protein n=1 Tax=Agromyces italicus TaxID=279572 RepID=UPI0003B3AB99|nr:transglutaminase domain-containing protein [Agromyces italicus]